MSIEGTYDRTNIFAKILRGEAPVAKVYAGGSRITRSRVGPHG
jgi:hypothetical protein